MNVIGKIGRFMIGYQNEIQILLLVILIGLGVFFIIKAALSAKKKKDLLTEISSTVTAINTTVNSMNEKKTEVIYIDNRVPGTQNCPVSVTDAEDLAKGEGAEPENSENQSEPDCKAEAETAAAADQEPEEKEQTAEAKTEPAVKRFFDRDCAVSKNGRTYSVEELNDQIKE